MRPPLPARAGRCAAVAVVFGALAVGCGPPHIRSFTEKNREYDQGKYAVEQKGREPSAGSLYSEALPGYLEDTRALRVGDIVLIKISEEANAQGDAKTDLSKSSDREMSIDKLLGLMPALQKAHPDLDPTQLLAMSAASDFSGAGKTARNGRLSGRIAVRVKREMPNGDLYVEGTKVVMINNEEYHLYVSGLVRPADIEMDNSIDSMKVADARVEFTGRGDVGDQVSRGWLTAFLDAINPF